jgi:predicted dehydrogenase
MVSSMPSSSETIIRWGVVGTGAVACDFASDLGFAPGAVLAGVCSRDPARAHEFARAFGARHAHGSIEELARNEDVDVVYIATPHVRHRDDCLACLAGGKPVLCEKPFTLNAHQAREVIDQAQARHLFCMEAMWMRFHPLMLRVRALIQSGAIGQVRLLAAEFGFAASYDPAGRLFSRELGGGALLDLGVYLISLAFFLLGRPSQVTGAASVAETGVDEQMSALLQYTSGAQAVFTASLRSRLRNDALIVGTAGQIHVHDPFFAPRRVSLVRFSEPVGAGAARPIAPPSLLARIKRTPLLRRAFDEFGRPVLGLLRRRDLQFVDYAPGKGYQFEAAEVMRCLRGGERESSIQPLEETEAILHAMDGLRRAWGLSYPADQG